MSSSPFGGIQNFDLSRLKPTETKVTTTLSILNHDAIRKDLKKLDKELRVLILSQNFTTWKFLSKEVKKILFTSQRAWDEMSFEDKHAYSHVEVFPEYEKSGLVEWKALKMHEKEKFTHVVSHSEEDLIRAARLRELLQITHGQLEESATRYRDKVVMKTLVKEKNIVVPNFASVEGAKDLVQFVKQFGLPVIVKPKKGYGSVNTSAIRTEDDLISFLDTKLNPIGFDAVLDMMVESFIEGTMYHIDGIVFDGEVKALWPSQYVNTVVNFQENRFIAGFSLAPGNALVKRLQERIASVIGALGGPSCYPIHAEAWVTPKDEIVFCEIASRTAGGGIKQQFLELFGISFDKTWSQSQCEDVITNEDNLKETWQSRVPIVPYLVGWIFIYPKQGKVKALPQTCDLDYVVSYIPLSKNGDIYLSRASCADAVVNILVKGETQEEVEANLHNIYNWFDANCEWDPLD